LLVLSFTGFDVVDGARSRHRCAIGCFVGSESHEGAVQMQISTIGLDIAKNVFQVHGNVWDNAAMESFFSSLKTERTGRKTYRTRDEARADVFDYIERFYNPKRRHSRIGYMSPMEFESQAGLA
jgi:hypothetical protein